VIGEEVFDAAKLTGKPAYATVLGILADWKRAEGALKKAAAGAAKSRAKRHAAEEDQVAGAGPISIDDLLRGRELRRPCRGDGGARGHPPPPDPHAQGLKPWHFIKAARTLADPGASIKMTGYAKAMDWEIELAAVIGKPAKDVSIGRRCPMSPATRSPTTCRRAIAAAGPPVGDLTVQDGLDQAQDLRGLLSAGPVDRAGKRHQGPAKSRPQTVGQRRAQAGFQHRQDAVHAGRADRNCRINMTLHPGDLILTGTPSGTGAESGTFLKAGDVVKLWIENIGEIENRMV
jgi:hypothetical protein